MHWTEPAGKLVVVRKPARPLSCITLCGLAPSLSQTRSRLKVVERYSACDRIRAAQRLQLALRSSFAVPTAAFFTVRLRRLRHSWSRRHRRREHTHRWESCWMVLFDGGLRTFVEGV